VIHGAAEAATLPSSVSRKRISDSAGAQSRPGGRCGNQLDLGITETTEVRLIVQGSRLDKNLRPGGLRANAAIEADDWGNVPSYALTPTSHSEKVWHDIRSL
jgi:hypothetical protein